MIKRNNNVALYERYINTLLIKKSWSDYTNVNKSTSK